MNWGFLKRFAFWEYLISLLREIGVLKQKTPWNPEDMKPGEEKKPEDYT